MKGKGFTIVVIGIVLFAIALAGVSYLVGRNTNGVGEGSIRGEEGNEDTSQVTIGDAEDSSTIEEDEVGVSSKEWPKDISEVVPKFNYGDILSVEKQESSTGVSSWIITFGQIDEGSSSKYRHDLENKGWEIDSYNDLEDLVMVDASFDDLVLNLVVKRNLDEAVITVST